MDIGVMLPYVVLADRRTTIDWCRRIDDGPFASLGMGERLGYDNLDQLVTLSAAAVLTERVRLLSHVMVLPLHPAPLVAKRAATIDVLSEGRLTLAVGVGWREDEFTAVGASFAGRYARQDEQVAQLRRVWAGEPPFAGVEPIGPRPVQSGGPPILCSARGSKALARAALWADGYAGFSPEVDRDEMTTVARTVRAAWTEAGRDEEPYLMTSTFFALGDGAPERLRAATGGYARYRDGSRERLDKATVDSPAGVERALDAARESGYRGLMLIPTTGDLAELDRLETVIG
jgi:alkanesulfonate monooxygenase SsuD/methylene tetrahydromethanopterin reductase-like flavin-dependent oxidoreductase (luciferase family)